MNCLVPAEIRAQNMQNKKLDRQLQIYKRTYNKQIKLLLWGTSGSGKSTFIRQIRLFYDKGFSFEERMGFIKIIHHNIFTSMQIMIQAMQTLDIPYETKENAVINSALIKYVDLENSCLPYLNEVYLSALKELWADAGIQECFMHRKDYQLLDSTKYFMQNIDRVSSRYYIPSDQDILRVYMPPTGIMEYVFNYKNVDFRITDVGFQRSARKKWLQCFDNVTSIIFLVAISEYDQYSGDSPHSNRLRESRDLFKSISLYDWFADISIILVLNKCDLLEEKIMHSNLEDYFPEFNGPKYDPRAARTFILNMFMETMPNRRMYHHFTSSTDIRNTSIVFVYTAVRDTILSSNLYNFNLI